MVAEESTLFSKDFGYDVERSMAENRAERTEPHGPALSPACYEPRIFLYLFSDSRLYIRRAWPPKAHEKYVHKMLEWLHDMRIRIGRITDYLRVEAWSD
jgi:hypothetical protein